MLRHHYKCVELVKPSIPANDNLLENNSRQGQINEQGSPLPRIRGHKIYARLANAPCDLCHVSTVRG